MVVGGFRWLEVVLGGCRSFLLLVTTLFLILIYLHVMLVLMPVARFGSENSSTPHFRLSLLLKN